MTNEPQRDEPADEASATPPPESPEVPDSIEEADRANGEGDPES